MRAGSHMSLESREKIREARKAWWAAHPGYFDGPRHPCWKGGVSPDGRGYIRASTGGQRRRYLHGVLMEQVLGRPLAENEVVHHLDGDGLNNDPGNLVVMTRVDHLQLHRHPTSGRAGGAN